MFTKTISMRTILYIVLMAIIFCTLVLLYFNYDNLIKKTPEFFIKGSSVFLSETGALSSPSVAHVEASILSVTKPFRIRIPKININASVISVGLTSTGAMDAPESPHEVAWYNQGPIPGEIGNAVLVGHYGWKDGVPAVFDVLYTLIKGDEIYIEDENKVVTIFSVNRVETYKENQDASDVFISTDGKVHLNLITCGGDWNEDQNRYSNRTVVFADKK
ncbi:MAG: class F sortase [Candidatus Paceibacterota bacterium]